MSFDIGKITNLLDLPNKLIESTSQDYGKTLQTGKEVIGQVVTSGAEFGKNVIDTGGGIVNNFIDSTQEVADRGIEKGTFTVRHLVRNIVSVVDDKGDQFFETVASIEGNITNTIQLGMLLFGAGAIIILILFHEELSKNGISLGAIKLF